jgi:hypothetical protein
MHIYDGMDKQTNKKSSKKEKKIQSKEGSFFLKNFCNKTKV